MKYLIFALLLIPATSFADLVLPPVQPPDISWRGGGIIVFRQGYVPTTMETLAANSGIKFNSFSDFRDCVDSKSLLSDKILDEKPSETKRNQLAIDALTIENNKR